MAATVDTLTLVDRPAIQRRLDLGPARIHQIVNTPGFPARIPGLSFQVWKGDEVEAWIDENRPESSLNPGIRASVEYAQAA